MAAGMDDFLTKPVLAANLMTTVERWTARRTPGTAAQPTANTAPGALAKPETPSPFDPAVLAALPMVLDGSEPEYAQELLTQFLDSLSPTIKRVEQLIDEPDLKALQRLMHTLKSTSASMGATEMAEWAATQEAALRSGIAPQPELPQQLRACAARLAGAIDSHAKQANDAEPVSH
jgi:HPt (histidine-containing phosphotransfer) domain-containing protein